MPNINTTPLNCTRQTAVRSFVANEAEQAKVSACPWTSNLAEVVAGADEGDRRCKAARAKVVTSNKENESNTALPPNGRASQSKEVRRQSALRSHFTGASPSPTSKSRAFAPSNQTTIPGVAASQALKPVAGTADVSGPNAIPVTPLQSVPTHGMHADKVSLVAQQAAKTCQRVAAGLENWVHKYLGKDSVEDNGSHIPCVAHSAVSINMSGQTHHLHANRIQWNANNANSVGAAGGFNIVAGQAPRKFDACEKLVLHAIESKQGIFQIVSPQTHSGSSTTQPVIGQLLAMGKLPAKLGKNHDVVAFKQTAQTENSIVYELTVRSLTDGVDITIPLTQVGLRFDDALLRAKEIDEAENLLNAHIALNTKLNPATVSEPVIISQAGVGRNAAVIVYHAIMKEIAAGKITTEKELDAAMIDVIVASRKARGPHFLHSQAQINELLHLLTTNLPKA